jgi:tetratricopeptide (TPR) repeat protein
MEMEEALRHWSRSERTRSIYLAYDRHFRAMSALGRTLWLQGHPAQAVALTHEAIESAQRVDQPESLVVILVWAASVFFWIGDLQSLEKHMDSSISLAESHSLGPLLAVAQCRKAELAIRRGDETGGVASLRAGLETLHAVRFELVTTEFDIALVQGLAAIGGFAEALTHIDETIRRVETNGDVSYMPELLRVKAGLLRSMPAPRLGDAEKYFMQSLELSRHQGARGWELRTATDLAALFASQGRPERGLALLRPVFGQFREGFDTADLKAAERLLASSG